MIRSSSFFITNKFIASASIICSIFILFNLAITCDGLPIFDDGDSFVPDSGDLQRNSQRLHRTLFLLDTSNLLKKARLLGVTGGSSSNSNAISNAISNMVERSSRIFRFRREAKPPKVEATKYINVIKVRKPFLSLDGGSQRPGLSEATRR
ncbi:uncharacterized protein LOC113793002 [Dermatophagoides pteronyssinus]|uniref:Uncharacterized protein n=2 Tax=Dermatophagoides pteronyssinus TaxID=6956 RepID=A0ABQ8JFD0_DERPT|nr:uncharacterized protein LOC113793002 [Dermatophagoides pteronyssinus]KAH9421046.1 hypothetical protein DERP_001487 [Dermatophagoides pteronyssinus]